MHSAGTTVGKSCHSRDHCPVEASIFYARPELMFQAEGSWDEVMKIIGQAHVLLHDKGIVRIQTDIRVGSR